SVRRTAKHVSQTVALLEMPIELKRMVQRNEIAATQAAELYRQHGDDALAMINATHETTGKGKVTKKDIETVNRLPRMTKKVQQAVRTQLNTVTVRLASIEPDDIGAVTLVLDADEVQELLELRAALGLDQE